MEISHSGKIATNAKPKLQEDLRIELCRYGKTVSLE